MRIIQYIYIICMYNIYIVHILFILILLLKRVTYSRWVARFSFSSVFGFVPIYGQGYSTCQCYHFSYYLSIINEYYRSNRVRKIGFSYLLYIRLQGQKIIVLLDCFIY